ncbi:MAG: MmcQ/YjbR family DNA-binding protein [Streptosporangiaceae bacterium]
MADQATDPARPVTLDDVRAWALALPRTEEHLIREYVKFRVGRIVYATVSPDEAIVGFGFPREERAALIAAEPDRFLLERRGDARYNWIDARMATLRLDETREFITDAWRMVVPKSVAAQIPITRNRPQSRGTHST